MSLLRHYPPASLFLLLTILSSAGPVRAQDGDDTGPMTRIERTQQAQDAFDRGDYRLALQQADALLERWPRDEHGLITRAAVLLFGPEPNADEAGRMLRRLPRARRQSADVEALDLWKDYRYGFNFMPTVRERLQMDRARDLLDRDPQDPIANLVAGMMRVDDQRSLDHAARLTADMEEKEMLSMLSYAAEAVIDETTGRIRFENRRTTDPDLLVTWNDEPMRQASEEAVRFLIRAAASGPLQSTAIRYLTESAIRGGRVRDAEMLLSEFVGRNPASVRGHVYLGLIRYMLRKDAAAEHTFEQALALMAPEDALVWLDPRSVVSTSVLEDFRSVGTEQAQDFWARQDREWSRPGNERKLEHMGRMAYADVIWGREDRGLRGWEVEPGQVLIRYGFPLSEAQFQTTSSRFHILHYGSRYWLFEDMIKTGNPIFYSPPADAYQGGRAVILNDWTLIAHQEFRDNPLVTDLDEAGRLVMNVLPSVLQDDDGRTVVAAVCIEGAAFAGGSWIRSFVRPVPASAPTANDSTRVVQSGQCPSALVQLSTDTHASQVSLEARNGAFWSVGRFDVPESAGEGELLVSDLVLASLVEESEQGVGVPENVLVRNGLWIHAVAEARYDRGQPLYLYSEAYGLDPQSRDVLSVEAVLVEGNDSEVGSSMLGRMFGRKDEAAVSVTFEDVISQATMGRYLILETVDLIPGLYTLAIRVTERSSGRQAVSRREIRID